MYVSAQTRNLPVLELAFPFPVLAPISVLSFFGFHFRKFSIWYGTHTRNLPVLVLGVTHSSHFRYWALPVPVRSFTGPRTGTGLYARGPISGMGLCQFRYGHSLGPVPELDSMRAVPFPVRGSASSGTDIHWAPYRNWTLCAWSHTLQRSKEECGSASLSVLVNLSGGQWCHTARD